MEKLHRSRKEKLFMFDRICPKDFQSLSIAEVKETFILDIIFRGKLVEDSQINKRMHQKLIPKESNKFFCIKF